MARKLLEICGDCMKYKFICGYTKGGCILADKSNLQISPLDEICEHYIPKIN